jgi:hypothetical protein
MADRVSIQQLGEVVAFLFYRCIPTPPPLPLPMTPKLSLKISVVISREIKDSLLFIALLTAP